MPDNCRAKRQDLLRNSPDSSTIRNIVASKQKKIFLSWESKRIFVTTYVQRKKEPFMTNSVDLLKMLFSMKI